MESSLVCLEMENILVSMCTYLIDTWSQIIITKKKKKILRSQNGLILNLAAREIVCKSENIFTLHTIN